MADERTGQTTLVPPKKTSKVVIGGAADERNYLWIRADKGASDQRIDIAHDCESVEQV